MNHLCFMLSPIINDPLNGTGRTHPGVRNGASVYGPQYSTLCTCLLRVKEHRALWDNLVNGVWKWQAKEPENPQFLRDSCVVKPSWAVYMCRVGSHLGRQKRHLLVGIASYGRYFVGNVNHWQSVSNLQCIFYKQDLQKTLKLFI